MAGQAQEDDHAPCAQHHVNPHQLDLEQAIRDMANEPSTVMLVDDERDYLELLADRLAERQVSAAIAFDGESALHMIQEHPPELMILDLNMPGISGVEVLRRIHSTNPDIRVVILTGHGDDQTREACLAMGAHAYLQKPVDIDELIGFIDQIGDGRNVS